MASVKTAISIQESLFRRVERMAKKLGVSRSRLFALAAEDFLTRHDAQDALRRLNEVHAEPPAREDRAFVDASRASLGRLTKDDEW